MPIGPSSSGRSRTAPAASTPGSARRDRAAVRKKRRWSSTRVLPRAAGSRPTVSVPAARSRAAPRWSRTKLRTTRPAPTSTTSASAGLRGHQALLRQRRSWRARPGAPRSAVARPSPAEAGGRSAGTRPARRAAEHRQAESEGEHAAVDPRSRPGAGSRAGASATSAPGPRPPARVPRRPPGATGRSVSTRRWRRMRAAARAERQPDRGLAATLGGLGEEQARHVRAGDEQDDTAPRPGARAARAASAQHLVRDRRDHRPSPRRSSSRRPRPADGRSRPSRPAPPRGSTPARRRPTTWSQPVLRSFTSSRLRGHDGRPQLGAARVVEARRASRPRS